MGYRILFPICDGKPVFSRWNGHRSLASGEVDIMQQSHFFVGERINRLTYIRHATELETAEQLKFRATSAVFCVFKCDCGTVKFLEAHNVKNGRTKSCGCLRNEKRWGTPHRFSVYSRKTHLSPWEIRGKGLEVRDAKKLQSVLQQRGKRLTLLRKEQPNNVDACC